MYNNKRRSKIINLREIMKRLIQWIIKKLEGPKPEPKKPTVAEIKRQIIKNRELYNAQVKRKPRHKHGKS